MDLAGGRYPQYNPAWLLAGSPTNPFTETGDRRYLSTGSTGLALTSGTMFVVPLLCDPGLVLGAAELLVKTASATPSHGWVALYTGVAAASTLITQTADDTSGFHGAAATWKTAFGTAYQTGGQGGTPQNAASTTGPGGPVVLGLAVFNQATTGAVVDGFLGSNVAGGIAVTGDVGVVYTVTGITGATAPATLAGIGAATGGWPYVKVTRS